jgi:YD repeat-containing protein
MKKAMYFGRNAIMFSAFAIATILSSASAMASPISVRRVAPQTATGTSTTLLPNDDNLLIGGENANGVSKAASLSNPQAGSITPISAQLQYARAWHTATLLPDGSVLVLGGIGSDGTVVSATERLSADGTAFGVIATAGLISRAYHTATLLTDGRVLIVGGTGADGKTLGSIQIWDFSTGLSSTLPVELSTPRSKHTATLLPDGTVLIWGGVDAYGVSVPYGEIIYPTSATVQLQSTLVLPSADPQPPQFEASLPQSGATDVPLNTLLSLRFSKPIDVTSVNANNVILTGPDGVVSAKLVPAEGGMLLFVMPQAALESGAAYTLSLSGVTDNEGQALPVTNLIFNTTGDGESSGSGSSADTALGQESSTLNTATTASAAASSQSLAQSTTSSTASSELNPNIRGYFSHTPVPFEQVRQTLESSATAVKIRAMGVKSMATGGSTAAPEIVALANALKNDPDLIYQYVHDNIEFDPLYGALKGPVGTLLDGRGDSFDQAALMVALLNQASLSNSAISNVLFEIGSLNLTSAQLQSWLGVDSNPYSIGGVLAQGGIPCTTLYSNGNIAGMGHAWVKVSINGTAYVFDPAFKSHTWKAGMVSSLASIMGYSKSQFTADAGSPTITSNSIQGVNRVNLRNDLTAYSNNLASYIRSSQPSAGVSDIVGGGTIVPSSFTITSGQTVRQTTNPNQGGTPTEYTSIPSGYFATLSITLPGATAQVYNSSDIYGHRLSIFFNSSYVPTLYLDGSTVVSGSASSKGAQVGIQFSVHIPWACVDKQTNQACTSTTTQPNYWADQSHTQYISAQTNQNGGSGGYIVMNGWDQVGRGMIEKHRKLLNQAIAGGATTNSESALGESLEVEGYTWLAENAAQQQLSDQLLGTKTEYMYGVGIVGEAVGTSIVGPYVDLPMNFIDTPSRLNGASTQTAPSLAAFLDASGTSSSFESASLEQLQAQVSGFQAASTVKLIDIALQNGNTIYDINSSNWSTIEPLLAPNYNTSDLTGSNGIGSWVSGGYRVIAPSNGKVAVGQWTGVGYKAMKTSGSSYSYGEEISGGLSGGFSGTNVSTTTLGLDAIAAGVVSSVSLTGGNDSIFSSFGIGGAGLGGDPLDLVKGSYQYKHDDLTTGAKGFPYGLSFERSYDSGAQGSAGPLGSGWTHNYAITATVNSDGFTGMGQASPLSAVRSIVALYVSSDLVNGQTAPNNVTLENFVLETVVNRWFTDSLTGNVVNVSQGWNSEEFTLMADGSYAPPLGSATILDGSSTSLRYRTKTGVTMNFNSSGQISSWNNAAGASVSFSYTGGVLSSVSNSATGRSLTLSYSGTQISSVTDGTRTVSYGYSGGNLTSFTDALNQITAFAYDASGVYDTAGHLTQVKYPSNPSNAFVTNYYDGLGRVWQQKDAVGNTTQAFFAGSRTEIDDPVGNRHVWYNDPRGNVLEEIQDYGPSPHLNITVSNIYNAQSVLLATVMPEGNYATYTYDSLFNPLTITQTPKPGSPLAQRVQRFTYTAPVSSLPNFEEVYQSTDPNGNVTTFAYNWTGTVSQITQPTVSKPGVGSSTPVQLFTYTSIGLPQTATDAEGRVTRYDYYSGNADQVQKLTVDNNNLKLVTQYGYDSYGDANSVTDANGNTTTSTFDALRRVSQANAAISGVQTNYTYYPDGQVNTVARQISTGSWETTQYTYTLADMVYVVTDPLGNTTTTTYDADDRVSTVTQQVTATANRQRTYSYDALSRLYQLSDTSAGSPGTLLETHSYTLNGNPLSFIDANSHATSYTYDGFDRLSQTTYPDSSTEQYTYDANGNALQKTTRSGQTISITYDALNRVSTKTPQNEAAGQVTYGYDLTGRLLQASDGSTTTPYQVAYDTAGRANSYTDQEGRNTQVQYDGVGNRTQLQWPAGTNGASAYYVTYQYDAMNRMTEIDQNGSTSTPLAKYQWDLLSRQSLITYGDGTTDSYSNYDAGDNLQTLTQNYNGVTGNEDNSVTFSYTWQKNHQRASTGVSNGVFQYVPVVGTTSYGTANADNGYVSLDSSVSGSESFTYDGNQNMTFDGVNTLTYDVENRLIEAQNAVPRQNSIWA